MTNFYFDNPAHRQALYVLDLLNPAEVTVSPQALALRISTPEDMEAILYILKQEIAQPLSIYSMIEMTLEMTYDAVNRIQTREDLSDAQKTWKELL